MIRAWTAVAACVALAGCGGGESKPDSVFVFDCAKPVERPRTLQIGCGNSRHQFAKITFSSWGGTTANAFGRAQFQSCDPTCAEGRLNEYATEFEFSRIVRCDDEMRYYSRVVVTYKGEIPPGLPTTDAFDVAPTADSGTESGSRMVICEREPA